MREIVPFTSDSQVEAIAYGLLDTTLPKSRWTHAGHLAATFWFVTQRPDVDISQTLPGVIRAYNVAAGGANTDTSGYHETITQASIRAARAFLAERPVGEPLFASVNAILASPFGEPAWLSNYWTDARLFSTVARREWCEPDLRPLPF